MKKYGIKIFSILCMTLIVSGNIKSSDVEVDAQDQNNNQTQMSNNEDDQQIERNNKSNKKMKKKRNKKRRIKKSGLQKNQRRIKMKKKRKVLHKEGIFDENGNSSNGFVTYSNGMSEKGEFKENKLYNGEKKYPSSIKITDGKKENIKYDDRTIKLKAAN